MKVLFLACALATLNTVCVRSDHLDWNGIKERIFKNSEAVDYQFSYHSRSKDFELNANKEQRTLTAFDGQFPYHVHLSFETRTGTHHCSGVLIGPTWILTAAQCTERVLFGTAFLGSANSSSTTTSRFFYSKSIHQNPSYDPLARANDLALINIQPVSNTSTISAVKLPSFAQFYEEYFNVRANVTGWGFPVGNSPPLTEALNFTSFEVASYFICPSEYNVAHSVGSTFCVETNFVSTCHVDAGSPLVLENELIGIASFMPFTDCNSTNPARFVDVVQYLDWIKGKTGIAYE